MTYNFPPVRVVGHPDLGDFNGWLLIPAPDGWPWALVGFIGEDGKRDAVSIDVRYIPD